jgi:hypothetical protein
MERMMRGASPFPRAPIRRTGLLEGAAVVPTHEEEIDEAPMAKARQTGAAALPIRLHGVPQDGTFPSNHITSIIGVPRSKPKGALAGPGSIYRRGSRGCSTMNAHPELSLGFLSAFLMIWIFMIFSYLW